MKLGNIESLIFYWPEMTLVITVLLLFLADLVVKPAQKVRQLGALAVLGLTGALVFSLQLIQTDSTTLFGGMVACDPFAVFFKILIIAATILIVLISARDSETNRLNQGEYLALIVALALGACVFASATNLLMIYLSLELVSMVSYVLAGFIKLDQRSSEASMKYVIYGGVASGAMIYGMSFIYGLTGSMELSAIAKALSTMDGNSASMLTLFVASILCLAGLGYKVACVPFHMWCPDVYEGSPTPVTAFFSIVPTMAGFAAIVRFFYGGLSVQSAGIWSPIQQVEWPFLLAVVACATMTLGNLVAIHQNSMKRMLAYSSIAHAGYVLMALVVLTDRAVAAMLFYLAVYFIMNLGAFLVVIMVREMTGSDHIDRFRGLGRRGGYASFVAVAMTIFLFSLTGLPPTAGFIGKVYLFAAVLHEKWVWLALVGVINSVVSLYYYARVVKTMFFDQLSEAESSRTVSFVEWEPAPAVLLGVLAALTLLLGLYWTPLAETTTHSIAFLTR